MRSSALYVCLSLAATILTLPPSAHGQTPSLAAQPPPPAAISVPPAIPSIYAEEPLVIEHLDNLYSYNADGTGFRERTVAVRVQSEAAARAFGVISVPYAGNSEQVQFLYVRVRHPDGTVVNTPTTDAIDMPEDVTRQAPFYSDLEEKQLPIRSIQVGDTLEWKARVTRTKSEAPGNFWDQYSFADSGVVLSETLELRVPTGVYVNVWSPTAKPTQSSAPATATTPAQTIYRWASSQLKPTTGKAAAAAAEAQKKHVWTAAEELDADQGKLPSVAWTTFKSWQAVGDWYRSLELDRTNPTPDIQAKVAELIAGKSTDEDKVRALYAYVSTQIRYIGVAFGIGRYQPHAASDVLSNQYGDCKDKHTLLAAMLRAAGFQPDAVLIGAGVRFNPDVPSPAAFNHCITHLTFDGQTIWLDSTAEIAPYRMLVSVIRDKQALVVPGDNAVAPYVARTPAAPPFVPFMTMNAVGSLDQNGTSHSRLTLTVRGDAELALRAAFRQVSPSQYDQLVQQIVHNIGYAGTSSNSDVTPPDDTAQPFKMSFDYEREKAGDWDDLKIIPQVMPISLPRYGNSDPLVRSLDLGYPTVQTSTSAMKIPDGWTAILPEALHYKCPYVTYDETYRFDKGTVYATRSVAVLKEKVPVEDLKVYKKWADDADLGNDYYIQLVRPAAPATSTAKSTALATPPSTSPTTASATTPGATKTGPLIAPSADATTESPTDLLRKAIAAVQQKDYTTAAADLDKVKAINPEEQGLWSSYAFLASAKGSYLDAETDLQKEIKLHPGSISLYGAIFGVQLRLAQRDEAMDTLRTWIAANPLDPNPPTQLMAMLVDHGDFAAAASVGQAASMRLPSDDPKKLENFHVTLGDAEIKAGQKDAGRALLEDVLKSSDDAGNLNNAAYSLADAGLDLPLADASTRAALQKFDQESDSWTLDENPQLLLGKSSFISATWDTMGWILFREGNLAEAQSYLTAAWVNSERPDNAQHLAEVALARGDKRTAMAYYELALAKLPTYNGMGVRNPPSPEEIKIQAHVDELTKDGVKSTIGTAKDPTKELQAIRTISLGHAEGRQGTAEYRVLLKDGKIVKSEAVHPNHIDRVDELLAKARFPGYFPTGSNAALVRQGYINCHSNTCEFVLEPL